MRSISRRQFLYFSAFSMIMGRYFFAVAATKEICVEKAKQYPITIGVLKAAYKIEMIASKSYTNCSRKALEDRYSNIAYLFAAFSVSEKIHADNYKKLLKSLCIEIEEPVIKVVISDTKANLKKASDQELLKIEKIYPDFLNKLTKESLNQAVINCMYSWKSHRQHERKMRRVSRYAGIFFRGVAKRIEGEKFNFHVCEICGSTIDEAPNLPCEICNYPRTYYRKVIKPADF